jgi:protein Mpv17
VREGNKRERKRFSLHTSSLSVQNLISTRAHLGHVWYTTLDRNVYPDDPKCTKAVLTKTALDQLLWAPAFSCVFFFFIHALDGHPEAAVEAIRNKLGPMLLANYALWPAAHLVNFRFVPSSQRILYINAVQILWSAYLSHLAARGMGSLR